ncbi:NAD(P)H-dependent oxidoreductase [Neisseria meningitidis]|uniref:NAD(P)H-dependent oxidoreductase n=1 Tax=Neisseria meningitidis TaxID=487 RepID=UPI003B9DF308
MQVFLTIPGYDVEAEIEKFVWMDAVIWQMPGWWMHEPWTVKKYIDEVLTAGHGKLYQSDGRHASIRLRATAQAACCKKKHMLSMTWNATIEAFTREGDFFEGKGVDVLYMHFHKANEFLGMTRLPTFLCNDVVKNPQVEKYLADYQAHLEKVFG